MTQYLHAACADIQWLMPVQHVLAVVDIPEQSPLASEDAPLAGQFQWRDNIVNTINMGHYFSRPCASRRLIVIETGLADNALQHIALGVENSNMLVTRDEQKRIVTHDLNEDLALVFDAIYPAFDENISQLVLRFPATWVPAIFSGVPAA